MQAVKQQHRRQSECPEKRRCDAAAASAQRGHQAAAGGFAKAQEDGQPPGVEAPHRQDREPPGGEKQVALVQPVRYFRMFAVMAR